MSDKRQSGPPDGGPPERGGRPRYGTQVFDSKAVKGSRMAQQGGDTGGPEPVGGRRGQPSAANMPSAGPDVATIGGLPITQTSTGRGRQGNAGGGRRGSLDNGRQGENGKGGRRRGSIDSGDQDKGKDTDDGMGGSESGQSQDQEALIQKQRSRVMLLSTKGDWPALDHALKVLERFVPEQLSGSSSQTSYQPLKDLADETTGYTPLMYAARENKPAFVDRLADLGCNPNDKNKEGFAAVHLAAMYSREETIRHLVQKKADINAAGGSREQTAAHLVANRSTGAAVALIKTVLMHAKQDLRLTKDNRGDIPLFLAVDASHQGLVRELVFHHGPEQVKSVRANTRDTVLHVACRKKDTDMVKVLVDAGASTDAQNAAGQTPLHIAAEEGDEATVKFFYSVHANPNITDKFDRTPIHVAAENGFTPVVDLLAEKFKASVMDRTKDGSTLVHIASLHGHPDTVMAFLRKGVPLHMPNKMGARCIHTAAQRGHVGVVNAILHKGEHVDVTTNDGFSALHIAVKSGKPAMVEALLGHGANLTMQGGAARESALHLAARVKDGEKCAEMLLKSGADANLPKDDGQTPLHLAAHNGNLKTLKLLLEDDNAKPLLQSKSGESPLHLACLSCRVEAAKMLLDHVTRKSGKEAVEKLVNAKNHAGETALHYAARVNKQNANYKAGDDREMANLLLTNGAQLMVATAKTSETPIHYVATSGNEAVLDEMLRFTPPDKIQKLVNMQSSRGWSPLLNAADNGHEGIVSTLLDNQARVDVFDSEGKAALHLAAEHGYKLVCNALLLHKAFINARTMSGLTALHLAAMKGYNELVFSLITQHHSQKDALTLKKQTPLHLAAEAGQLEVCDTLLQLGADTNATNDAGQKAVHVAAMRNNSEVVKLFLKTSPELVTTADKDGNTCAHIAAQQGSVDVVRELMRHNRGVVINGKNRVGESSPLHLAAEGGHATLVKFLVENGASPKAENGMGFTAVHLAARYGHSQVLDTLREVTSLRITSKKLGLYALHVAAHYGQPEMVRELLAHIPATIKSEPPILSGGRPFLPDLGAEADLTPLHLAAHEGNEGVVRILLNIPGVQADGTSRLNSYIPLHLACIGGHTSVVGLLLSKSAKQVSKVDKRGRTGLHLAAMRGHYHLVALLMGQGAELGAKDRDGLTPLHYCARAGHLEVVKLLVEAGASPGDKSVEGKTPIVLAVASEHVDVYNYLINKKHDSYKLLEDKKFVHDLTLMSKKHNNSPLEEYILLSPAPVDLATKLAHTLLNLSDKESSKDLLEASRYSENLATELVAISAASSSPGLILRAVDNRNVVLLDSLIEHEQKEVIAHPAVQRYLTDVWMGSLDWPGWKVIIMFLAFLFLPPVWIFFSMPLGHMYNEVPLVKFIAYLVSHVYMLVLMIITVVTPLRPIWENTSMIPNWYEWMLLLWLSGNLVMELTNPGDIAGLGWIKVFVLVFSGLGVLVHLVGLFYLGNQELLFEMLYIRNNLLAIALLLASVQLLDFLSFHHLFGPWAVIIGKLMVDLGRFLVILLIFVFGFSMYVAAIYNPLRPIYSDVNNLTEVSDSSGYPPAEAPVQGPFQAGEMLFFSLFGLVEPDYMPPFYSHPAWSQTLMKIVFGIYQMVTVVVLINLLIAMMSDTYQRIQAKSDTEWKFGLAKLIRNMSRTSGTPSPLNLLVKFIVYIIAIFKFRCNLCSEKAMDYMRTEGRTEDSHMADLKTEFGGGWIKKLRSRSKASITPQSTENLIPLSSMEGPQGVRRIENVIKWSRVVNRYRIMHRKEVQPGENTDGDNDLPTDSIEDLQEEALLNGTIEPNSTQPSNA
ncbi:serine/threonine-protein phosphatase 6 regulatory ankyrin repeat subunit C-like isoform X2 [Eriocheir sinensis]|uniref:serine/threonine-protein phosphatase 6 regulatory ankyrin repeat subunit C-like isoform X2 n=1 Tax=Eriocheir sinensis TaxID=95602 RepID=UPI0021C8DF8D|nr:serine/threonine-protein phosphatase 6 regulatory ankyrin repeat subunit C-like isoform X2 [Eriocheir sinensis]